MTKRANKLAMYLYIVIVVMLLALILSFDRVSTFVGATLNIAAGKVQNTARTVLGVAIGIYMISSGVAALAIPIIGISLLVVGVVLVGYSLWPYLTKMGSSEG